MNLEQLSELVQRMVDAIFEMTDPGATVVLVAYGSEADLRRYQPDWTGTLAEHRQVLNTVALTVTDRKVQLVQMHRAYYEAWLDGRQDLSALRSAWAAQYVSTIEPD